MAVGDEWDRDANGVRSETAAGGSGSGSGAIAVDGPATNGSGSGGGGWGTIGSGVYGKIGHGSGTCCDCDAYGGCGGTSRQTSRRPSPAPTVRSASRTRLPTTHSTRRSFVDTSKGRSKNPGVLRACGCPQPGARGHVTTKFSINADGHVTSSSASGLDPKVETCVAQTVEAIEFPKPKDSKTVDVAYPLTFRPAGR